MLIFSCGLYETRDNNGTVKYFSQGGLTLLKLDHNDIKKNEDLKFNFVLEYESFDGNKTIQNYEYILTANNNRFNIEYFMDNNIRRGISIYFFSNILDYIIELEKTKLKNNKERDLNLIQSQNVVSKFLEDNFIIEPNIKLIRDNLNKYRHLIDEEYKKFGRVVYILYNLASAPLAC